MILKLSRTIGKLLTKILVQKKPYVFITNLTKETYVKFLSLIKAQKKDI